MTGLLSGSLACAQRLTCRSAAPHREVFGMRVSRLTASLLGGVLAAALVTLPTPGATAVRPPRQERDAHRGGPVAGSSSEPSEPSGRNATSIFSNPLLRCAFAASR